MENLDIQRVAVARKYGISANTLWALKSGKVRTLLCPNQEIASALASVFPELDRSVFVTLLEPYIIYAEYDRLACLSE